MSSGERPTGAAKGNQSDTEALCQPPPPPPVPFCMASPRPFKTRCAGSRIGLRNRRHHEDRPHKVQEHLRQVRAQMCARVVPRGVSPPAHCPRASLSDQLEPLWR